MPVFTACSPQKPMKTITVSVELTEKEAWDYAEFLKRASFTCYRQNAVDDDESYRMQEVGGKIRKALAVKGIEPR